MHAAVEIQITDATFSDLKEGDNVFFRDGSVEKITDLRTWDDQPSGGTIYFRKFSADVYEDLRPDGQPNLEIEYVTRYITVEALGRLLKLEK